MARRVIFKKFEDEIKKTNLTQYNDLVSLVWHGYVLSQLGDCRKFFDKDNRVHSFKFIIDHLENETLKKGHENLLKDWKSKKLETILNKHLLHADKRAGEMKSEVLTPTLDLFIDTLQNYLNNINKDLNSNYSDIGYQINDSYLKDRESEVEIFFKQIRIKQ